MGYGVVGSSGEEQFLFGNPSHGELVSCHFYPYSVYAVSGSKLDVSYSYHVFLIYAASVANEVIFFWHESERVALDDEVIVERIVVGEAEYE